MFGKIKVLKSHGLQYIPNLRNAELPEIFRGRPEIKTGIPVALAHELAQMCPVLAIGTGPFSIDMGRCAFCGECALRAPQYICFTNDYRMASLSREELIVREGDAPPVRIDRTRLRPEIKHVFGKALKFRQVSAGGDNSTEMELNAAGNVNFDFTRFGVDFAASPRHSDGIVITGPITVNMAEALNITYDAIPSPKIIILAGSDAISGGLFAGSGAVDRTFLETHTPDLYLPGNPVHPLTFIHGCLDAFLGD